MTFTHTTTSTRYRPASASSWDGVDLPLGCWLVTPRRGFTHHGIYVGQGRVVHYSGLSRALRCGPVEVVSLAQFCGGRPLRARATPSACYRGRQAVQRALSRVGENRYHVITNNCEHFCTWCVDGQSRSSQVDRWLAWPRAMAAIALTGLARVLGGGAPMPAPATS